MASTRKPSHLISNSQSSSSKALLASVASIGSIFWGSGADLAPARSISAVAAGAWLIQVASQILLDLVVGPSRLDTLRVLLGVPAWLRVLVGLVDEEPLLAVVAFERATAAATARPATIVKRPLSFSPLSRNLSSPSATDLRPSRVGASGSQVPQSQTMTSPAPYCLAGMILRNRSIRSGGPRRGRRHAPDLGVEGRAFGYGPGDEDAVDLEAEVVVEAGRAVSLHHETAAASAGRGPDVGRRLRGLPEVALPAVFLEGHRGSVCPRRGAGWARFVAVIAWADRYAATSSPQRPFRVLTRP